jgi:hypothetical protein
MRVGRNPTAAHLARPGSGPSGLAVLPYQNARMLARHVSSPRGDVNYGSGVDHLTNDLQRSSRRTFNQRDLHRERPWAFGRSPPHN